MSYQVLARKWRPSNFSQVAGQSHVLQSLTNALDNERLHHAYLFTGTRGVGKTTLARILAKCLNCEEGITSKPCESCNSCTEINEGRFVDLIEVDAASRTKVDDTRELLDNVQYAPSRGRFKVYLIDEVHMLSNHSFNALLKTLEEPPPHVKFLFATTDPQKLPITILSRCLQFNLKNLSPELIQQYLLKVLDEEAIEYDEEALWQIASAASGSMRDALTLVDQAIAYCKGQIKADAVVEMLGVPQQKQVLALLEGLAQRDSQSVLGIIADMAEQSPDYANTLDSLLSALHRIALAQVAPQAVDNSFGDRKSLVELAGKFTAEDVQLYYQFGSKGREDLRLASDLRVAFEMLLLRMLVFSPRFTEVAADSQPIAEQAGTLQESPPEETQKKKSLNPSPETKSDTSPGSNANTPVKAVIGSNEPTKAPDTDSGTELTSDNHAEDTEVADDVSATSDEKDSLPELIDPVEDARLQAPVNDLGPNQSAGASSAAIEDQEQFSLATMDHQSWLKAYFQLRANGIVANVLANTVWQKNDGGAVSLLLSEKQSAVYNEDLNPRLEQTLSEYFQAPVQVTIIVTSTDEETPAALSQRLKEERHEQMIDEFEKDDNVQQLVDHFSAKIARESISPRSD